MRALPIVVPLVSLACRPACGEIEYTGGEATITLSVTAPDAVETTWTVQGGTEPEQAPASGSDTGDLVEAAPPGDVGERASVEWDRGPASEQALNRFSASLPVDAIPGLGCLGGAEVTAFEVEALWDDRGGRVGGMEVWGPEHDLYEPLAQGYGREVEVAIESRTKGSLVVRDIAWQRIVGDAFLVADCPERGTLEVHWDLDPRTRVVDARACEPSIFDGPL